MTAIPLWLRPVGYPRWCRLRCIGLLSMITVCRARIEPRAHVQICADPLPCDRCSACERHAAIQPGDVALVDVENLDDSDEIMPVDAAFVAPWTDGADRDGGGSVAAPRVMTRSLRKPEDR